MAPESCDLVLVDSVESELVGQPVGNTNEPAEAVGQGAVEVEDGQLESQGTLSVEGWKVGWTESRRQPELSCAQETETDAVECPRESNCNALADKDT